ncbi:acyltransferase family protein [Microvirga sp. 2MCAF35]|uniref:acyltransferase family protein n=1 Tax=Microvirga sp. 2MCAF35 TaxID=3232987 RepID=UPI003F985974
MKSAPMLPQRFFYIDLLRGLAALSVLIWHYQHFYMPRAGEPPVFQSRSVQPLYSYFQTFYDYGLYAVQFFWLISGFVFAVAYSGSSVSKLKFARNRFARLYPLNLITLLVVAGLQLLSLKLAGHYQIYAYNDLYHFALNILLVSHWGAQSGFSFNAPIWSVSVEIFVYIVFIVALPTLFARGLLGPLIMQVGFILAGYFAFLTPFSECGFYFFAGTAVFMVVKRFQAKPLVVPTIGFVLVAAFWIHIFWTQRSYSGSLSLVLLFAGAVMLTASLDGLGISFGKQAAQWLGDTTYGTYLWHVPVQITIVTMLDLMLVPREIANSKIFFVAYILTVLVIARASFRFIEEPARKRLRTNLHSSPLVPCDRRPPLHMNA